MNTTKKLAISIEGHGPMNVDSAVPEVGNTVGTRGVDESVQDMEVSLATHTSGTTKADHVREKVDTYTSEVMVKPTPTLLGIPSELRSLLYRLALIETPIVDINLDPIQPGALRTNRLIRQEATSIFFENDFIIAIQTLNSSRKSTTSAGLTSSTVPLSNLEGLTTGSTSKEWLKVYHGEGCKSAVAAGGRLGS